MFENDPRIELFIVLAGRLTAIGNVPAEVSTS